MGIDGQLKQISLESFEICQNDASLMEIFFAAKRLPDSPHWQREKGYLSQEYAEEAQQRAVERFVKLTSEEREKQNLKSQFLAEWEIPELDLDGN